MEYVDEMPYLETPVDIDARFNEILGVTYMKDVKIEDIFFAVKPQSVNYILTKYIHPSQDEVNPETEREFKLRYPSLKGCKVFQVSCRPNPELYARFASYMDSVIILEPACVRDELAKRMKDAADNYSSLKGE